MIYSEQVNIYNLGRFICMKRLILSLVLLFLISCPVAEALDDTIEPGIQVFSVNTPMDLSMYNVLKSGVVSRYAQVDVNIAMLPGQSGGGIFLGLRQKHRMLHSGGKYRTYGKRRVSATG